MAPPCAACGDGAVDECFGRIEGGVAWRSGLVGIAARRTTTASVLHRIDAVEREALALMLDPRRRRAVDQTASDGDDAPGEVALIQLPVSAIDGYGGVAAHAPALADSECLRELVLGDGAALGIEPRRINGTWGAAEKAAVGSDVVVLVDEGEEPDVDVVERGDSAKEVEAALPERSPEPFHFSTGRGVARVRVQQDGAEPLAGEPERVAAVRRAVVEVEHVGRRMPAQRTDEKAQH